MSPGALEDRAERLASLVDELGAALRAGGVADDVALRVLENASAAVLNALALDLMFGTSPPAPAVARTGPSGPVAPPTLPLAA
jgi:hypothetical protein